MAIAAIIGEAPGARQANNDTVRPSELGVHPTSDDRGGETWSTGQHHEISLMCDDIEKTVADLKAKGAEFTGGITDQRFGLTSMLRIPGAGEMMLYQPRHPAAYSP